MSIFRSTCLTLAFLGTLASAPAQEASAPGDSAPTVAATVNGQTVLEKAVQRRLQQIPEAERALARPEILNYLIENELVDQYLIALKIDVPAAEVEAHLAEFKQAAEEAGQDYNQIIAAFLMTEEEFTAEIADMLRWDKFVEQQATDDKLRPLFEKEPEFFDSTNVRARHILLIPDPANAEAAQGAKSRLLEIRQQVQAQGEAAVAKLPADADPLAKEQARVGAMDAAFADAAREHSECPSKREGGNLPWFPRGGAMVEQFAQAAFALKPYEMSEPIQTPFGYHLIMVTGRRAGEATTFEEVRDAVQSLYADRLRAAIIKQMRPRSKIEITSAE